jgi:thiamine-monophosphate kinase
VRKNGVQDLGEFGLIHRIRKKYARASDLLLLGIGDDAASFLSPPGQPILVTTDILIEDVHFRRRSTTPYLLGAKSLAVNLSDIAAMGGIPRFFLISLGIPKNLPLPHIDQFYRGLTELGEAHDVLLAGGDLTAAPKLIINGVAIGHCPEHQILYRKGAQPGDHVVVTGPLGDSALGLEILHQRGLKPHDFGRKGEPRGKDGDLLNLVRRHLAPTPRVVMGRKIAELGCATAMIDISDGLLADLGHILEESQVGAEVWVDEIPRSQAFEKWAHQYHPRPLDLALSGGEDYELLFTAPKEKLAAALSEFRNSNLPLYPIGEVTPFARKLSLVKKNRKPYSPSRLGYDHFRISPRRTR